MFMVDYVREGSVVKRNQINWRDQDNQGLQNAFIYGPKKEDYVNAEQHTTFKTDHTPKHYPPLKK